MIPPNLGQLPPELDLYAAIFGVFATIFIYSFLWKERPLSLAIGVVFVRLDYILSCLSVVIVWYCATMLFDASTHLCYVFAIAMFGVVVAEKSPYQAFNSIDRLVYEPVRFLALEKLWIRGKRSFTNLRDSIRKEIKDLTDGNLAAHLRSLEEAEYVKAHRYFKGRKPATEYSITDEGKKAFEWFLISLHNQLHYSSEITGIKLSQRTS